MWLTGSTLVDALITACMVTVVGTLRVITEQLRSDTTSPKLFQSRPRTFNKAASSLVQTLITLTVETAMITGFAALASAVLFIVFPDNNMHFLM
jgi:hypothetical protein